MKKKSILIVDDEPLLRKIVSDYLKKTYAVEVASSGDEAVAILKKRHFDLVISDIIMPGIDGFEVANIVRQEYPKTKIALLTAYDIDKYLEVARDKMVTNIIAKESPFNFDDLGHTVHNLLTGDFFGLQRYLDPDASIDSFLIQDTHKIQSSITQILNFCRRKCPDPEILEICDLIIDELLNNAIIHAPRFSNGQPKYKKAKRVVSEDSEVVRCDYGYDNKKIGVAVSDNFGSLENKTVMDILHRHISKAGFKDNRGRGLFISRSLTDRFIINIERKVRTEIIFLIYFKEHSRKTKPLCIYEI
ncbi:response regulator [candidate division CSSED10-310 bacterium]|uniref:Response regulator n=1 Tax=candidate division CSSED10-310 bacterium TaxID=2855610 RepID=A0ABV6Z331_UNCC1